MKKILLFSAILILVIACKKTEYSPEGPTDIRIRNLSDLTFTNVVLSTSEYPEDVDTISAILHGSESDYYRFKKAYPKAEISATIDIDGSPVVFSTGPVDYTYMQYIGQDMITYEVYISDMTKRVLTINNVVLESALELK
ncbi:MAG TPA: hypothetical protein VJ963_08710 [Bacteroidales bacterium]|nr:hypothetical protein [Bacteroidales bacterium]